jgi:hypothetical protein
MQNGIGQHTSCWRLIEQLFISSSGLSVSVLFFLHICSVLFILYEYNSAAPQLPVHCSVPFRVATQPRDLLSCHDLGGKQDSNLGRLHYLSAIPAVACKSVKQLSLPSTKLLTLLGRGTAE